MVSFTCLGHENIRGTHKNTFEITTDSHLTPKGDCIIGVSAQQLPQALSGTISITLEVDGFTQEIEATANPNYSSTTEWVIRITDYVDERTFATRATKSAKFLSREFIEKLKSPQAVLSVKIQTLT